MILKLLRTTNYYKSWPDAKSDRYSYISKILFNKHTMIFCREFSIHRLSALNSPQTGEPARSQETVKFPNLYNLIIHFKRFEELL